MRLFLFTVLLVLAAFPVVADDDAKSRFNTAYRAYSAAIESGDTEAALTTAKTALDIGSTFIDASDPRLAALMHNYGNALVDDGRVEEGREVLEESVDALIKSSGKQDPELINYYVNLANASGGFGGERRQLQWFKRALKVASDIYGKESIEYANTAYLTGATLYQDSQSPNGRKYLKQALEIYETELGVRSLEAGYTNYQLGRVAFYKLNNREATEYLLNALSAFGGDTTTEQGQRLMIRALLVQNYELLDESDNATKHCVAIGKESQFAPDQDYLPLFQLAPQYPHTQWRNGIEGHVVLSFTVDESGFVRNMEVVEEVLSSRSSGWNSVHSGFRDEEKHRSFEGAALAALERYRYAPRFVDGVAVPVEGVTTRVSFQLAD